MSHRSVHCALRSWCANAAERVANVDCIDRAAARWRMREMARGWRTMAAYAAAHGRAIAVAHRVIARLRHRNLGQAWCTWTVSAKHVRTALAQLRRGAMGMSHRSVHCALRSWCANAAVQTRLAWRVKRQTIVLLRRYELHAFQVWRAESTQLVSDRISVRRAVDKLAAHRLSVSLMRWRCRGLARRRLIRALERYQVVCGIDRWRRSLLTWVSSAHAARRAAETLRAHAFMRRGWTRLRLASTAECSVIDRFIDEPREESELRSGLGSTAHEIPAERIPTSLSVLPPATPALPSSLPLASPPTTPTDCRVVLFENPQASPHPCTPASAPGSPAAGLLGAVISGISQVLVLRKARHDESHRTLQAEQANDLRLLKWAYRGLWHLHAQRRRRRRLLELWNRRERPAQRKAEKPAAPREPWRAGPWLSPSSALHNRRKRSDDVVQVALGCTSVACLAENLRRRLDAL